MVTPESIQLNIAQGMATEHLSVVGDGTHFEAVIVSEAFAEDNHALGRDFILAKSEIVHGHL